jgi:hypothetical protein
VDPQRVDGGLSTDPGIVLTFVDGDGVASPSLLRLSQSSGRVITVALTGQAG